MMRCVVELMIVVFGPPLVVLAMLVRRLWEARK